ncbi:MAG TPA: hypothetical protein VGP24_06950 [Glaciihabitans sp.]|jgi:hypothetical protein|nr:hypothetical protein [Glaciihabitans sp.]
MRHPFRRFAVTSFAAIVAVLLTGCSAPAAITNGTATANRLSHIHALSIEPASQNLSVATHEGIFQIAIAANGTTGIVGPLGGLDFDPMGFTVRDGIAYASGHPGPTTPATFGSPNLGLIVSTDGAQTWVNVSLTGETDFHSLAVLPPAENSSEVRIFGVDPSTSGIQRSLDGGKTWTSGADLVARDLAATPGGLYATTEDGLAVSTDNAGSFTVDPAAPALLLVSADPITGGLAGVDVAGSLWATDPGGQWMQGAAVSGTPEAITVADGRLFVADDRGITFTDDLGATWAEISSMSN